MTYCCRGQLRILGSTRNLATVLKEYKVDFIRINCNIENLESSLDWIPNSKERVKMKNYLQTILW